MGLAWKGVGVLTWLLLIPSFQVFFVISQPAHNKDKNRGRKWIIVIWETGERLWLFWHLSVPSVCPSDISFSNTEPGPDGRRKLWLFCLLNLKIFSETSHTVLFSKARKQIDLWSSLEQKCGGLLTNSFRLTRHLMDMNSTVVLATHTKQSLFI